MEVHCESGGFTPPVVAKRTSRYRGPVGQNDRTGVNPFSACLLGRSDSIGGNRLDLLNQGDAIPLGLCHSKKRFPKSSTNAMLVEFFCGYSGELHLLLSKKNRT